MMCREDNGDSAKIEILRRYKGCVIVKKPVGAESEDKGEGSVVQLVRDTLKVAYAEPCHRLDKPVGGAMLVSIDKKATAGLCEAVRCRDVQKEYLCVCEGAFSQDEMSGEMHDLIFYDRTKRKTFICKRSRKGVKDASLSYEVIGSAVAESGKDVSLVRVILHTGRTHQIRAQFAGRRHPLCVDGKYGSHDNRCTAALWSCALTYNGERTECMPQSEYPWNLF